MSDRASRALASMDKLTDAQVRAGGTGLRAIPDAVSRLAPSRRGGDVGPVGPAFRSCVTIDNDGAVQLVNLQRWGDTGDKAFGYLPFGGDILGEKRFGDFVLAGTTTSGMVARNRAIQPLLRSRDHQRSAEQRPSTRQAAEPCRRVGRCSYGR
jgi:hypothetical protein